MRYFEKISFQQFQKDINDNKLLYEEYNLPKRSTKNSAGYDFFAIEDCIIKSGDIVKIPLGIKVKMQPDEVLLLISRSSMGFKNNIRLTNQVGVIDSDYYNNLSNEGHIWVSLQNHSKKDYKIKKSDKILQGIFIKYLTVDNEEAITTERLSGIGSTN